MGPGDLAHVLRHLTLTPPPAELLVGLQTADDAAVWRLDSERALVQTVDFFTPIVDDPYTYGSIAAANALSDVYAMGGTPFMALAIAGFPQSLPTDVLAEIFRGGADTAAEAGVVIAGGHTVMDDEPKYGLCVTGLVHPDRILTKAAAKVGDVLFLTKPLGTGIITTALKREQATAEHVEAAVASMRTLNRAAATLLAQHPEIKACTDVTGFSLLGHAYEMAAASGVRLEIAADAIPALPGALEYAQQDISPGGADRNRLYLDESDTSLSPRVTIAQEVAEAQRLLLYDPQTSGGLLFTTAGTLAQSIETSFQNAGQPLWRIGRCLDGRGVHVI
jgi:selenide,water dikinase